MQTVVIGIDIAKQKFDVAGFCDDKYKHKVFSQSIEGYKNLLDWCQTHYTDKALLFCMEATGSYSVPLADFLVEQGQKVSVVNPAKIHAFAKSHLSRAKTDKADAKSIARYAAMMHPPLWTPPPANIRHLQALNRRVEHLQEISQMEQNRLETTTDPYVRLSIETLIETLNTELNNTRCAIQQHINTEPELKKRADLLNTIKGIGAVSIAYLLVALSEHQGFTNAKQLVAFAGLAPVIRQSGQHAKNSHIAKTGDAQLRKVLYLPAMTAWTYNPIIRLFCERLKANGKNGKAIICAAMRKLLHLAFAILKSGKPFDPSYTTNSSLKLRQKISLTVNV